MAPTKNAKPPKSPKLTEKKTIEKPKKKKKKNYNNFFMYIYKVLRSVAPEHIGIFKKSVVIMNSFVNDMLEKIAWVAGKLTAQGKKSTLSSSDIQTAVRLLIPGELGRHSLLEAFRAIKMYRENQPK